MEWESNWYSDFANVDFIKIPFKLPPGHARNIGLNHFYSTEEDYCVILDDDTYIEEGDDLITSVQNWTLEDAENLDLITVVDPMKESNYKDNDCHSFVSCEFLTSGVFIFKNFRKHHHGKEEVWFNPQFVNTLDDGVEKLIFGEDVHISNRVHYYRYGSWECTSSMANKSRLRQNTPSTWANKAMDIAYRLKTDTFLTLDKINISDFSEDWINKHGKFELPKDSIRTILKPKAG